MSEEEEKRRRRFEKCWKAYFGKIRNYAYHLYHNPDDAQDATAVAFGKLWVDLDTVREGCEYAWLRAVVWNDFRNSLGQKKHISLSQGGEEGPETEIPDAHLASKPEEVVPIRLVEQALYECIDALPEKYRCVIIPLDTSVDETVEALGIPKSTVIGRRYAARKKLAKCLTAKGVIENA